MMDRYKRIAAANDNCRLICAEIATLKQQLAEEIRQEKARKEQAKKIRRPRKRQHWRERIKNGRAKERRVTRHQARKRHLTRCHRRPQQGQGDPDASFNPVQEQENPTLDSQTAQGHTPPENKRLKVPPQDPAQAVQDQWLASFLSQDRA
jgi:hypothetical protein